MRTMERSTISLIPYCAEDGEDITNLVNYTDSMKWLFGKRY